jgi:hypothetical protein
MLIYTGSLSRPLQIHDCKLSASVTAPVRYARLLDRTGHGTGAVAKVKLSPVAIYTYGHNVDVMDGRMVTTPNNVSFLPNLSMLTTSSDVPEAKRARPLLVVTESTEILAASASVLEMLLAEFAYGMLKLSDYSTEVADLDSQWEDADAPAEMTALRDRLETLSDVAVYALDWSRTVNLQSSERWRLAFPFLEVIERRSYNSSDVREMCNAFLTRYLEEREIPPNTAPAQSSGIDYVYNEYFPSSRGSAKHLSGSFNTIIRVLSVHNRPDACVGVIMLDDRPEIKINGTSKLPQWEIIGVLSCPFYRTYKGGAATAILKHLKERVEAQSVVKTIYVDVLKDAPDFWKYTLFNADFIDCPRCELNPRRLSRLLCLHARQK